MDNLGKIIEKITKPRHEEDFIDRLNYSITVGILLAAAFTIIAKEYGGDPIQCWLPAELASQKGWEEYAEDYCFVENTYYIPLEQNIPYSTKHRGNVELTYYQWVPFLLILQALMFTFPHIFWRMLNWLSGIQIRAIITMACSTDRLAPDGKEVSEVADAVALHLHTALRSKQKFHYLFQTHPFLIISRLIRLSYLCFIYLTTKLLFIGNAVLQYWLLNFYLGASGYDMTMALLSHQTWESTGYFPRVTMCDFRVRGIGNRHTHTIQCVLMANMFNEKIYIGLWWWILIVLTLTCLNFIYWLFVLHNGDSKYKFLVAILRLGQPKNKILEHSMNGFMRYVGADGILVTRLMAQNAGEIITSMIIARLYDLYIQDEAPRNTSPIDNRMMYSTTNVPHLDSPDEKTKDGAGFAYVPFS
ncbi:hypothetical protein AB6A40_010203 [Gnathostoma spinigerum]|uniref:Innexin n=1 Tax=Gnathostoma spinigerum TaxID=75299 RepID=A0ABD6F130_9BILA